MSPMHTPRRASRRLAIACLLVAVALFVDAGYVHAKAWLAQVLLERAWQDTLVDGGRHAPWPWADAAPVARLIAPRLGISRIVLGGDDGRALAFAPGWSGSTAAPGTAGLGVVSAHRDTHFRFLADLVVGDAIDVETSRGLRRYRIASTRIVDSRHARIDAEAGIDGLLLVTCWPFDAIEARGPLRYVVEAHALRVDDARG